MRFNSLSKLVVASSTVLFLAACQPSADEPTLEAPAVPEVTEVESPTASVPETEMVAETPQPEEGHDAHDHDAHDHGGEAHLHGHAELSVSRSGNTITVNLEAPLANFGLSEANTDIGETAPYADATAQLIGGSCLRTETGVSASSDGTHGKMLVELVFTCDDASKVTGLQTGLFAAYSGFEHIDAVALSDAGQNAVELTRSATLLTLP